MARSMTRIKVEFDVSGMTREQVDAFVVALVAQVESDLDEDDDSYYPDAAFVGVEEA